MAKAIIRATVPLPDLARGATAEVDVTDRVLSRAAKGLVRIERAWDDTPPEDAATDEDAPGYVDTPAEADVPDDDADGDDAPAGPRW